MNLSQIETIRAESEAEATRIAAEFDTSNLTLETESLKPAKTDVKVELVALLWLPFDGRGEKAW